MKERKRTNKKYSPEFKLSVILYMRNNHLSYHETIRKYWGNDVYEQNYIKQVQRWERKYLEEGIAGLEKENRGHPNGSIQKAIFRNISRKAEHKLRLTVRIIERIWG